MARTTFDGGIACNLRGVHKFPLLSQTEEPAPPAAPSARRAPLPANQITALFDDVTLTFSMPAAATLADLAQRLAREAGWPRRRIAHVFKLGRKTDPRVRHCSYDVYDLAD